MPSLTPKAKWNVDCFRVASENRITSMICSSYVSIRKCHIERRIEIQSKGNHVSLGGIPTDVDIEYLRENHNPNDESHKGKIRICFYCILLEQNPKPTPFVKNDRLWWKINVK